MGIQLANLLSSGMSSNPVCNLNGRFRISTSINRSHIAFLVLIILLAFIIRAESFEQVYGSNPERILGSDSPRYEIPALNLVSNGVMSDGLPLSQTQDLHVTPGYPFLIAAVYRYIKDDRKIVVYLQLIISCLSILVVFYTGREVFGTVSGLASAALLALDPLQTLFSQILLVETLFIFTVSVVSYFAVRLVKYYLEIGHVKRCALFGVALGVASLVKPVAYYLVFCFLIGLLIHHILSKIALYNFWPVAIIVPLMFLTMVTPWHVRNGTLTGSYAFTDNPAEILLYWKAGGMIAHRDKRSPDEVRSELAEQIEGNYRSLSEKIQLEKSLGFQIIKSDIPAYLNFTAVGVFQILAGPGVKKFETFYGSDSERIPSTDDTAGAHETIYEKVFNNEFWVVAIVLYSLLYLVFLYAFSMIALFLKHPKQNVNWTPVLVLFCLSAYFILSAAGHTSADSRMRMPAMPMIVVLAGYGFSRLYCFFLLKNARD